MQEKNSALHAHAFDYTNSLILGVIIGFFLILPEINLGLGNKYPYIYILSVIGLPILCVVGIFIAKLLFSRMPAIFQFIKFGVTGVSNTAVNFGIVNAFVYFTDITKGPWVIVFSTIAFIASLSNSYFWNSHWSFKNQQKRTFKEFMVFALVTVVGLVLNSGIVFTMTQFTPPDGISGKLWINIANVIATMVVMFWNFFGFKLIVFKDHVGRVPAKA